VGNIFAQVSGDTLLAEVVVTAFSSGRNISETPASVNTISSADFNRGNTANVLGAINNTPGVRMDERSPGSYRLSIRGSSLRSPFGVRNVKIYYNNIPLTDPGGFSYFNQIGLSNINDMQILKGPSSSLYGAGNGGVVLLNSMPGNFKNGITVGSVFGAYSLNRSFAEIKKGDSNSKQVLKYERIQSDGYRQQSAMKKEMIAYDAAFVAGKNSEISIHGLYNHLSYQTPGALTLKEYQEDPSLARPWTGTVPGAVVQQAHIKQDNFLLGFSLKNIISQHWHNLSTVYGLYSKMENPTIRNYSKTIDPHFGGRSSFSYRKSLGQSNELNVIMGGEAQMSFATIGTYGNKNGILDTLQSNDEIKSSTILGFVQTTWKIRNFMIEAGFGVSNYEVALNRVSNPGGTNARIQNSQLSPRFAALYKFRGNTSLYANIARGYSSPSTSEFAPSGSLTNTNLKAEYGWNYELGVRGKLMNDKLIYDASIFYYELANAIVLRKDSAGGDNYINAGSTNQSGFEAKLDYLMIEKKQSFLSLLKCWASFTVYHFKYNDFTQGGNDFSGKTLPGTSPYTVAGGIDAAFESGISLHATYFFSDKTALNDANSAFADSYHLLGLKCAYQYNSGRLKPEIFVGVDNLLNEKYSLGNDINAAGGRYYNAAMPLNVYAGLVLNWQ
jgi:iron complex outermembrane receptor protein